MRIVVPVPRDLCQDCGLCCRFSDPDLLTPWAARRGEGETLPVPFHTPVPLHLEKGPGRTGLPAWICSALDSGNYRCTLWEDHPADCRLYPLVVVRRSALFHLALDTECPFSSVVPRSFFDSWARRFLESEWKALSAADLERIAPLADREDRPGYPLILLLPFPADEPS